MGNSTGPGELVAVEVGVGLAVAVAVLVAVLVVVFVAVLVAVCVGVSVPSCNCGRACDGVLSASARNNAPATSVRVGAMLASASVSAAINVISYIGTGLLRWKHAAAQIMLM